MPSDFRPPDYWPSVPREIATAVHAATTAADAGSREEFDSATGDLAAMPFAQVASVSFRVVRELMETLHPDGIEGDDVTDALEGCARASVWHNSLDVQFLAVVLIGALGVGELEDVEHPVRNHGAIIESSALVIAYLAKTAKVSPKDYIVNAVGEIARAETVEMP